MGAEVLKEFLTRLGFEVDEAGMKKFNSSLASSTTRALAFGAAVQAAAVAIHAAVYRIASTQDELLNLSESTGIAVGTLQELAYVAEQTGSSADRLHSSLANLQNKLAEATLGRGGIETFQRLGIRIKDANGQLRATEDVLADVGEKLKGMDRGRQEMFLGQLGIDRSLVSMLTEDVGGLREAYRTMYEAAGLDAQKSAEDSRTYVKEVKSLTTLLNMLGRTVAAIFVGEMAEDVGRFRKTVQENIGKIIPVIKVLIEFVLRFGKAFGTLTARIFGWIGNIVEWFDTLDDGTQRIILGVLGFAAAWKFLNLSFLATPIGIILTGLIALVAVIDDFMTYMEGGESLFDWGPWAGSIMAVVDALRPLMDGLGQVWDMVKGPLFASFQWWADFILDVLEKIGSAFASLVLAVVRLFTGDLAGAVQAVMDMLTSLSDIISSALDAVGSIFKDSWSAISGFFGGGEQAGAPRSAALAPSPAQAAAVGSGSASINASTVIHVDGSGSPEATARAVGRSQAGVNADLVRHARGAAR